jgi:MoaA/NifB/PqqE/SkfB family radical SAM enzyme
MTNDIIKTSRRCQHKVCIAPFFNVNINAKGEVYTCCEDYIKCPLGNLNEQSFEEIWNGPIARQLRRELLSGKTNNFCNLQSCNEQDFDGYTILGRELTADEAATLSEVMPPPKHIRFNHDSICNVACITCRRHITTSTNEGERNRFLAYRWQTMMKSLWPHFSNVELISANGGGELFASNHMRLLIKSIAKNYPKVKFRITTNGVLMSAAVLEELGLTARMQQLTISLHAATKETYNRMVIGGDWDAVMKNIEYASSLKKARKIEAFNLISVVTAANFRDLPKFIELAHRFDATPSLHEYHNWWGKNYEKQARELMIVDPRHRDYQELVKVLSTANLSQGHFSPAILKVAQQSYQPPTPAEITASEAWHNCEL